jgi:hypothetical protein
MKSFKQYLIENSRSDYEFYGYHGHNSSDVNEDEPYNQNRKYIFVTPDSDTAGNYGNRVHQVYIRRGLKHIDLTDERNHGVVTDKFPEAKSHLESGTLWRNKPLEKKIIDHLHSQGHDLITLHDQEDEEGNPSISLIVKNPQKNVFVGEKK